MKTFLKKNFLTLIPQKTIFERGHQNFTQLLITHYDFMVPTIPAKQLIKTVTHNCSKKNWSDSELENTKFFVRIIIKGIKLFEKIFSQVKWITRIGNCRILQKKLHLEEQNIKHTKSIKATMHNYAIKKLQFRSLIPISSMKVIFERYLRKTENSELDLIVLCFGQKQNSPFSTFQSVWVIKNK